MGDPHEHRPGLELAQAYPRRSYVPTVDYDRLDGEILTGALRDAVTERIVAKKQSIIS